MSTYQLNKKNKNKILLIFAIVFIIGMSLCSYSTTPVFPDIYGGDSAIFALLGEGIISGKTLYVDLFDHKGPLLFFIEALGQYIGGITGIFVLQCFFGLINLYFSFKIWDLISEKYENKSIVSLCITFICTYSFFFAAIEGGNLSEEYSLPFITICFYLFVKYALTCEEKPEHPYAYALFYGVSFTCMAFMRVNNAIPVVAGVFAIFCYLVYRKAIKSIIMNVVFGLVGCIVATVPFVMYFIQKDALYDMVYATFLYNFKYASNVGAGSLLNNPINTLLKFFVIIISVIIMVTGLIKTKKEKKLMFIDFFTIVVVSVNVLCLLVINQYLHYFLLYVPILLIVLSAYWKYDTSKIKTAGVILCVAIYCFSMGYSFLANVKLNYITKDVVIKSAEIREMAKKIPEEEKDSVLGFEIPAENYIRAGIIPCYKYYTYQSWWSKNDPSIMESYLEYVDEEKPKWLLVNPSACDKEMQEFILDRYELTDNNKYIYCFHLKE